VSFNEYFDNEMERLEVEQAQHKKQLRANREKIVVEENEFVALKANAGEVYQQKMEELQT
jgi:hypothetical protein